MPFLHVTLRGASDLPSSDFSFAGGKSDPYVTLQVNATKHRTSCLENTLNPVWDPPEQFVFPVSDALSAVLSVKVYGMDTLNSDDLLGTLVLPVAKFVDEMEVSTLENYQLSLASEFTSEERDSTLLLEICLKHSNDQERHVYVWKNESWCIGSGWKPTHDSKRQQWSSFDDLVTSATFAEVAPRAPAGLLETGWQYCLDRGDTEGWLYASALAGPWISNKPPLSFVRRRLWENTKTRLCLK